VSPQTLQTALVHAAGVIFEKPTVAHLAKKFLAFYGSWSFITVFTRAHHWSIS
jgi:hypothetical protein